MKRPVPPSVLQSDNARQVSDALRRLKQLTEEMMAWVDSGTRTTDLPAAVEKSDEDYIEIVQGGVRRKITVAELLAP